jgi:hypothetical protein
MNLAFTLITKITIAKVGINVIKVLEKLLENMSSICYICNKEFDAHSEQDRDNCLKKFVDKAIDS